MTTLTPNRDGFEVGLRKAREQVFSHVPKDELGLIEQHLLADSLEAVMRPVADLLDRGAQAEQVVSTVENALANALGSVAMSLSTADLDLGWRLSLHILAGMKSRLRTRLRDLDPQHTTHHRFSAAPTSACRTCCRRRPRFDSSAPSR